MWLSKRSTTPKRNVNSGQNIENFTGSHVDGLILKGILMSVICVSLFFSKEC